MSSKHEEWRRTQLPFGGVFKAQFNIDDTLSNEEADLNKATSDIKPSQHEIYRPSSSDGIQRLRENPIRVQEGSPWHIYKKRYDLTLGENVLVSQLRTTEPNLNRRLYAIRSFDAPDARRKVQILQKVRHESFINISHVFLEGPTCYTISELDEISLFEFCKPKFNLTETQLAAIIYQLLQGIEFLSSQNLQLGLLTCSHVVVSRWGVVKIANPQDCSSQTSLQKHHVAGDALQLQGILLTLMEKSEPEELPAEPTRPHKWSPSLVEFSNSLPYRGPAELLQDHFLLGAPDRAELAWIVSLTKIAVHIRYDYK
ncbi:uncharacterized protein Z519_12716 [Cladophialophora bantiana CBS 173.52]|uniref:Protein kinase domain-containing protein n=1 Tax=Cladophialophora bantiana (strain ATCC 10958 / CBS 173.52 / CDC B-1940 / NIH 8579) TaxID=1442370 RepID=A0A0D2E961_CLAB1|nr:uncharacterized protein Z519_12716 [Cladophialophora bantiana CBS 173.52]KIW86661.1 hypothetical protein Z519_12716 [Cladophialophora bantiana CBS 173.52]